MAGGWYVLLSSLILAFNCFFPLPAEPFPATDNASFAGSAETGRRLFTGELRFRNGGAACIACHSLAALPGGGGVYGPDLTKTFSDYGAEGLDASLTEIPFPSMKPIYGSRPLHSEERGHLAEFLRTAGSASQDGAGRTPGLVALAGVAVFFLLLLAFGKGRLTGVRKPLLENRKERGGIVR
jgi:mono/diheme cytochrome c family protein